jgi:hypothetical protein
MADQYETQGTAMGEAVQAADNYTEDLEGIADNLNEDDGASLGTMVESQLQMTEAETKYNVGVGVPKKYVASVAQESGEVKKKGG